MTARVYTLLALLAASTAVPASSQTDSGPARDTLAPGGVIPGPLLRRLPIDDPRQAFTLIPGVVLRGEEIGIDAMPLLSIRGGGLGQASVYVDGAPARFQTLGVQGLGIAPNAVAEAWVNTGVAPALVADAGGGGVIAYSTPSGGSRLAGDVRWDSDEPFGDAVTVGYNRIEGSLGGPLPIAANLTFYLAATLQGQASSYRSPAAAVLPTYVAGGPDTVVTFVDGVGNTITETVPVFVQWSGACAAGSNNGFDCQGLRRPMDWSTARRGLGKLRYTYGTGASVSLTALASDLQQRFFPGQTVLDPALYSGSRAWSRLAVVNWHHPIGSAGALALDVNASVGSDRIVSGLLEPGSELETRDPALGIVLGNLRFAGLDSLPFPLTEAIVRNVRTNAGLRTPYYGREDLRNIQPYRVNPYGMLQGWPMAGSDGVLGFATERRVQGRGALRWRPAARHDVTVGVDAERTSLSVYQSNLIRQAFMDVFVEQPSRVGVFASDRLAAGRAVLDLGVRYDRFAPGGAFPTTPGRIYTHPAWSPNAATSDTAYAASLARVFDPTPARGVLTPRVRLAYAIAPSTSVRLGYARQVEPPAYGQFFHNANVDLGFVNTNDVFGRDVDFATTSLVEAGARHEFADGQGFEVSIYRKGLPVYGERLRAFADVFNPSDTMTVWVPALLDGAYAIGLDARVDLRAGAWLTGAAVYSVLGARAGDGSDDATTQAVAALGLLRVPADWKAGTVLGRIADGVAATATLRVTSGLPYTPLENFGFGEVVTALPLLGVATGSETMPWSKRLDLRITKSVQAGGRQWTAYADFRNVFNSWNVLGLFAETGDVVNAQHRLNTLSTEWSNLRSEASNNGALDIDGNTIHLTSCGSWTNPVNCVALTRVERRFGDGNGAYSLEEQERALNAYYDAFFGSARFYGAGRTVRLGVEVGL